MCTDNIVLVNACIIIRRKDNEKNNIMQIAVQKNG